MKKRETIYYKYQFKMKKIIMKPIFKEFCCPQCGELRNVNINGICFDCNNENTLISLAKQRKLKHKLDISIQTLSIES